jgi:hypothetical protein
VTGRRWKDIALDGDGKGGRDYIVSRSCMTDRRAGNPVLEPQVFGAGPGSQEDVHIPAKRRSKNWTVSGPLG